MRLTVECLIYRPGLILPEPCKIEFSSEEPHYREMNEKLGEIIGCEHIEHVNVLFRNKLADMFVDEVGAKNGLPVNDAATMIYHEASRRRGEDMADALRIHGVAVLSPQRIWF